MIELSGQPLTLREIAALAHDFVQIRIPPAAVSQMEASREMVRRVTSAHAPVYGVNTGFGKLCEVRIPDEDHRPLCN